LPLGTNSVLFKLNEDEDEDEADAVLPSAIVSSSLVAATPALGGC